MTKPLLAILLLLPLSALAQTQVPNVFEDGTPATAAEVNENFQYILNNASGECSATQQDNRVLIECADGTSGVIVGAGTVVVYPTGQVGAAPDPVSVPTGQFVWQDANGITISKYLGSKRFNKIMIADSAGRAMWMFVDDFAESLTVAPGPDQVNLYYTEPDCAGTELIHTTYSGAIFMIDELFYVTADDDIPGQVMFKSSLTSDFYGITDNRLQRGFCSNFDSPQITSGPFRQRVQYQPPNEWGNAAYPLNFIQLP